MKLVSVCTDPRVGATGAGVTVSCPFAEVTEPYWLATTQR